MASIKIVMASPLLVSDRNSRTNVIRSLEYIPGTAVRGALAALYIRNKDQQPDEEAGTLEQDGLFQSVFVDGQVRFGNLYPEAEASASAPMPVSARTCKLNPGFHADNNQPHEPEKHGIFDIRLDEAPDQCMHKQSDRDCTYPLARCSGFYYIDQTGNRKESRVSKRLIAHNAVSDFTRATKAEAGLYSYEAVEENSAFFGYIQDDEDLLPQLGIGELKDNYLDLSKVALTLGLGRSRGMGRVGNCIIALSAYNTFNDFLIRNSLKAPADIDSCFSIALYSDAILMDTYLRYRSTLNWQDLVEECNQRVPGIEEVKFECSDSFVSTRVIAGWNDKHGLPKSKEIALAKGSVFVFSAAETLTQAQKEMLKEMFTLVEREGIGERKEEGFGRLIVNDSFHREPLDTNHIRE